MVTLRERYPPEMSVDRITSEKREAVQQSVLLEEQLSLSKAEVVANKDMLMKLKSRRYCITER